MSGGAGAVPPLGSPFIVVLQVERVSGGAGAVPPLGSPFIVVLQVERVSGGAGAVPPLGSPFIGSDAPAGAFLGVVDEYDPMKPNDYETFLKMRRAEKQKEREKEKEEDR